MKKIYNAPEAGLLCFRPVEGLANEGTIDFDTLMSLTDSNKSDKAAIASTTDIFIPIG